MISIDSVPSWRLSPGFHEEPHACYAAVPKARFRSVNARFGPDPVATAEGVATDAEGDGRTVGRGGLRSPLLPGGDLVTAVLDRELMSLADRGGASNLIGARWADVAAAHAMMWPGQERPNPEDPGTPMLVDRVARLDDVPQIATAAARKGLQNPDLLLFGTCNGKRAVQAADAKFSIETARAKQVSVPVVEALLGLGRPLDPLLGSSVDQATIIPGIFLTPDYTLTHLMLERRQGILRATVREAEVVLVPVHASDFFGPMEGSGVMRLLAAVDNLPRSVDDNLLVGLYYMRLARAAIGCWLDATKPLLVFQDQPQVDEVAVEREAAERAAGERSAFQLVRRWNSDVDAIRNQRIAIDQVAMLPIGARDLRVQTTKLAEKQGYVVPSGNQVRRRLGAWYRRELRDRVGPLLPPLPDLSAALAEVARAGAAIAPELDAELARIVAELGKGQASQGDGGGPSGTVGEATGSESAASGVPGEQLGRKR